MAVYAGAGDRGSSKAGDRGSSKAGDSCLGNRRGLSWLQDRVWLHGGKTEVGCIGKTEDRWCSTDRTQIPSLKLEFHGHNRK